MSFLLFSTDSCGCARTSTGPGELPAGFKQTATSGCGFPLGSAWRQQLVLGPLGAGGWGQTLSGANYDSSLFIFITVVTILAFSLRYQ